MPAGRQRRPSGAPPPLPRHIERSGYIWLAVAIVAVGGVIAVFAGGLSRWAVDVTVIDDDGSFKKEVVLVCSRVNEINIPAAPDLGGAARS